MKLSRSIAFVIALAFGPFGRAYILIKGHVLTRVHRQLTNPASSKPRRAGTNKPSWSIQFSIHSTTKIRLPQKPSCSLLFVEPFVVENISPTVLVTIALSIGFLAQRFINQQLDGDQGLSSFLKDGRGYSGSKFRPVAADDDNGALSRGDPLPWLKLPSLDYVDVAKQAEGDDYELQSAIESLERLRNQLNEQIVQGNEVEASILQSKMERIMAEKSINYQTH